MPVRVFHADDNPDDTRLIQLLLEFQEDVEHVGSVNDPAKLMEAVKRARPDVLLLDYRMGAGVDPNEVIRSVVRECPATTVVCLTGYDEPSVVAEMKAAGARACVVKGRPIEEILEAIRDASRRA